MPKRFRNYKTGFSLIEMLVYIVILVFMLVIVLEVVVSVVRSDRVIETVRVIENSAIASIERVGREVRQADSINTAASSLGVHPGVLVLSGKDGAGNPRTVEFYLSGGQVMLKENGVNIGALSESSAEVTSLIFRRFAASTIEGIRTEMTIESGTSTHYRVKTFYSSATIR